MVIGSTPIVRHGQAVRAVAFREAEHACTIHSNQEVVTAQTIAVEHFLADQGLDSDSDDVLHI